MRKHRHLQGHVQDYRYSDAANVSWACGRDRGNLVTCPCGQNRVRASPNPGCFYEDDEDDEDAGATSHTRSAVSTGHHLFWPGR